MRSSPVTVVAVAAAVLAFLASTFAARAALADPPAEPRRRPPSACDDVDLGGVVASVVRVDAYEHADRGVVVGDGRWVVVSSITVEVARPGAPDAFVVDDAGTRHDATLVVTSATDRLALLHTNEPVGRPMRIAASDPPGEAVACALVDDFVEGRTRLLLRTPGRKWSTGARVLGGAPVVARDGSLVAVTDDPMFSEGTPGGIAASRVNALFQAVRAQPDDLPRTRRPFIFYGGGTMSGSFAPHGSFWFGGNASLAVRYDDLVELRLDGHVSFLLPKPSTPDTCAEPPCFEGVRGMLTPTIGPRLVLGGSRAAPIAVTPAVGWAFVAQTTGQGTRVPTFEKETPSTWSTLAIQTTVSAGPLLLRTGVLVPRGDVRQPTIEVGFGFLF